MDIRDAFFEELYNTALMDKDVVFLTADMGAWGLTKFKADMPERYFNVGIAEQNLINVATGLSLSGKKVFAFAIAHFIIYRCFEQIKVNLCDNKVPVTLIGAGPGLTYKTDGPTHHTLIDVPIMTMLGIPVLTPHNEDEAREALNISYHSPRATYIRLGRGEFPKQFGKYRDNYADIPFSFSWEEYLVSGESNVLDR